MQQLKEFYERQDTEELLEIAKKDLTEGARAVLQQVLASRNISAEKVAQVRDAAVREEIRESQAVVSRRMRLLAFAIDTWGIGFLLALVLMPLRIGSEELYSLALVLVWTAYFLFRDGIPGQGIGKRMLGIRTVQVASGHACTWAGSFLRNVTHLFFLIDALFILGERRTRAGDLIAGTRVVRATAHAPG